LHIRKTINVQESAEVHPKGKGAHSVIPHIAFAAANIINKQQTDTCLITPMKIEALFKDFKTHRCELDIDKGFIKAVITEEEV
jgi:hypothetical protein